VLLENEPVSLPGGLLLGDRAAVRLPSVRSSSTAIAEALHGDAERSYWAMALDAAAVGSAVAVADLAPLSVIGAIAAFHLTVLASGLYRRRTTIEAQGVGWAAWRLALGGAAAAAVMWGLNLHGVTASSRARWVAVAVAALVAVRVGAWLVLASQRRRGIGLRRALLSGPPAAVQRVVRRVPAFPEAGLQVTALHCPIEGIDQRTADRSYHGPHKRALDLIDRRDVDHVLLVAAGGDDGSYEELVHRGAGSGIAYSLVVPLTGLSRQPLRHRIGDLGVLPLGHVDFTGGPMPGKRAFDVVVSTLLLTLLAPVLLLTAAAVWLNDRGTVLYRQQRVGLGGRLFRIWKFRSMIEGADLMLLDHLHLNVNNGLLFKADSDPRVTRVGSFLRRFSLDELPQLVNVLLGDMSLVGPRPLPVGPDDFDERAAQRHAVRPGITGPWQVHGGNALSYDDMVDLDLAYISTWSFRNDLMLLLRTIPALFVRRAPY
jgi:exopolysaccharide biosynthesis polyprenyl glycosylphosphotransferase